MVFLAPLHPKYRVEGPEPKPVTNKNQKPFRNELQLCILGARKNTTRKKQIKFVAGLTEFMDRLDRCD